MWFILVIGFLLCLFGILIDSFFSLLFFGNSVLIDGILTELIMEVVLNKDVKKLGYRGDVIKVKPGYYRNFLNPRGLADVANKSRLKLIESRKEKMVMERDKLLENANEVLAKLKGLTVTIKAKVSDKGTLYAGISEEDVIKAVEASTKIRLEKEYLKMDHFKDLGEHTVLIHLGPDLEEKIKVLVESE